MADTGSTRIAEVVGRHEDALLADWLREPNASAARRDDPLREPDQRAQAREFLSLFTDAIGKDAADTTDAAWRPMRQLLRSISESRARQGFTTTEVATFALSFSSPGSRRCERR